MRRRPRTRYTENQEALMWERWKKGETLHEIARLFDRDSPTTKAREISSRSARVRATLDLRRSGGRNPPDSARTCGIEV